VAASPDTVANVLTKEGVKYPGDPNLEKDRNETITLKCYIEYKDD